MREELAGLIRKTDWREDLIISLKQDIQKMELADVSAAIGAEVSQGKLLMKCFWRDVAVGPDGEIEAREYLTPWMKILLLLYIKNGGGEALSGRWVLHSELRGGMMKASAFRRECEEPLRDLFDRHFRRTAAVLDGHGAEHPDGFPAPNAWLIRPFPRVPLLFLYWPEEDEFESKVTIRFDASADRYFDVEQLIFLVEEVIRDIDALV